MSFISLVLIVDFSPFTPTNRSLVIHWFCSLLTFLHLEQFSSCETNFITRVHFPSILLSDLRRSHEQPRRPHWGLFLTRLQIRHIRFIGWPGARMECRHRLQGDLHYPDTFFKPNHWTYVMNWWSVDAGVRAQWRPHRTSPLRAVQPHLLDDGLSLQPHESVAAQHQRVLSWPLSGEKKECKTAALSEGVALGPMGSLFAWWL